MTETVITTPYNRVITVTLNDGGIFLQAKATAGFGKAGEVQSFLSPENAVEIGTALLDAAGETPGLSIGALPEVTVSGDGWYNAGGVVRSPAVDADNLLKQAKALLAIHARLVADRAAKKAKEAAKAAVNVTKRRDALVQELTGDSYRKYSSASEIFKASIDRIIELEAKVQPPKAVWPAF